MVGKNDMASNNDKVKSDEVELPPEEELRAFKKLVKSLMQDASELLGYHYQLFDPSDLGHVFWQTIPLVLVVALMNGDTEPAGTAVIEASESGMTYRIQDFEKEVVIPSSFATYLKQMGSINQMVRFGILSERIAKIVEKRLGEPRLEQKEILPSSQATGHEETDLISSLTALGVPVKDAETASSSV